MEYLIVFAVAALMMAYVLIIGRCLRNTWPNRGASWSFQSGNDPASVISEITFGGKAARSAFRTAATSMIS